MSSPDASFDPQRTVDPAAEPSSQPGTVDVSQPDQLTDEGRTGPYVPTPPLAESTSVSRLTAPPVDLNRTGPYLPKQTDEVPTIPGYRITAEIAKGGMGRVYAGHDLTFDREVAIKTLLPGADVERFVTEAKITAKLPHPNIPPVHALGALPDGTPWLAMKLIHGQTLATLLVSRRRESAALSDLPRLIQIFEQIAQAVGFAHSRGVIHRDLKPLNVMVGEFGEVQVMDWGLAKDTTSAAAASPGRESGETGENVHHTTAGAIMGTPGYMAPEQARGEVVDQRADVFALGSILAAILTGKPAFVGTSKLETIQKSANADLTDVLTRLDTCGAEAELIDLARRCLAASPDQRPSNGQVVANEVAAYRASVEARLRRAETEAAQAQVRVVEHAKRRRQFVWAAGVVMLTLTVGLVASLWQMNRAIDAEQQANRNAEESEKRLGQVQRGNAILLAVFEDLDIREQKQKKEPLEAVLASRLVQAARELEGEAVGDTLNVAALQIQLGRTLMALGHAREAVPVLERALSTWVAHGGEDRSETLLAMNVLAAAYHASGQLDKALPLQEECLQRHQEAFGRDHKDTLASLHNLAVGYRDAGLLAKALPLLEEALRRSRAKLGYDHPDTLASLNDLAVTLGRGGQSAKALPLFEETLRLRRARLGPDHPDTLSSMNNLALAYGDAGDLDKAVQLHEEVLQLQRAKLGSDHPATLTSLANLAAAYQDAGQPAKALPLHEEAFRLRRDKLGPHHPETLTSMNNLASALLAAGQRDRALSLHEEVLELRRTKLGPDHPDTLTSMNNLALGYRDAKLLDKALPLQEEVLRLCREKLGTDHPNTLSSMNNLAATYNDVGEISKAVPLYEEALAKRRAKLGEDHPSTLTTLGNLALAYCDAGQSDRAVPLYAEYFYHLRKRAKPGDPSLAGRLTKAGEKLLSCGRPQEAEAYLRECLAIREKPYPDHWSTFHVRALLGAALLSQKKYADAEPLLVNGYEGMKAREQKIPPAGKTYIPKALDRLIELYTALKKPDEVKKYKKLREQYSPTKEDKK